MKELEQYGLTVEDLPDWMRPYRRRIHWPTVIIVSVIILVCVPVFLRDGLPPSQEAELEMWRVYAISEHIRDGYLYPQWSTFYNRGYGSPVFTYLAPLPHYLGGIHNILSDEPAHTSVRFVFVVGMMLGIVGTFSFVRQRWGPQAGIYSAVLFAVSPYLLRLGPFEQADGGELLAIGLFPVCLWAVERVLRSGQGRDLATLSIVICLLLLAENTLSLILVAVVMSWGALLLILEKHTSDWRLLFGGISLGLFLSAFYLLPYFTESRVHWVETGTPVKIDGFAFYLSLPLAGLVAASMVWAVQQRQVLLLIFQLELIVLTVVIVFDDGVIWSPFYKIGPLLSHDLVGLWTILAAMCAGIFISHALPNRAVFLTVGIIMLTLPYVYLDDFQPYPRTLTVTQYREFEEETGILATVANGNLLPDNVHQVPDRGDPFLLVSPDTTILFRTESSVRHEYFIQSNVPQRITVNSFMFDGWSITVDGEPVTVNVDGESGLMEITGPEGEFELVATVRHTFLQFWGFVVSGITLLMIVTLGYGLDR